MPSTKTPTRFALTLLAATCLTPVGQAQAAPGDPIGPEFQVNSFTTGDQAASAIAMDADGDFVAVWSSYGQDGDGWGVFAQRYDAAGAPQGPEIQVNSTTVGHQALGRVAMDADGDFVVVWEPFVAGYLDPSIFARRYNALGEPQGPEFQVNTATGFLEADSAIAMDGDGDFVVAWRRPDTLSPPSYGIFARRYNAAGAPQGDEFQVNTTTAGDQRGPAVAMDADGDFIVIWAGDPGDRNEIFGQRFDAAGGPRGSEFQVNTTTMDWQQVPSVAMDAEGDFVVTWTSEKQDGGAPGAMGSGGVFAQRFDAAGSTLGAEFQVNSFVDGDQGYPQVAMDADGNFVVAWFSEGQDGSGYGVYAQRYDAAGALQGSEFPVNATTAGSQSYPSVAMDADGDFVVAWSSYGQDGDGGGIFAQRFDGAERVEGDFDGDGKADLLWRNPATGQTVVWLMDGDAKLAEGSIGTVPSTWEIAGTGDFNGDGKADVLWRNSATGTAVVWQMNGLETAAAQSIGAVPTAWTVEQLRDTNGDGLSDIVWRNAGTGRTVVWRMSGFTKVAADPIGSVNSDWDLH